MSEKVLNGARAAELWEAVKGYVGEHGGGVSADGNPIGTVISFMGKSAPKDYLICDGAEYSVSDYPALAAFFEAQFGAANYFGGNGTNTFAVPDLRNLFLRGYHGAAEEQLSGEVGERQKATEIPNIYTGRSGDGPLYIGTRTKSTVSYTSAEHYDSSVEIGTDYIIYKSNPSSGAAPLPISYTARPVNMAVLYCIKAVESASGGNSAGEVYSTEETRIGTWIDGKPLYQIVIPCTSGPSNYLDLSGLEIDSVVSIAGILTYTTGNVKIPLCDYSPSNAARYGICIRGNTLEIEPMVSSFNNMPAHVILKYTKKTG